MRHHKIREDRMGTSCIHLFIHSIISFFIRSFVPSFIYPFVYVFIVRYGEAGEEMSDEITQRTLLPEVRDPNLWMVKCR